jgi:single-strand DNA-binding protein
MLFLKNLNTSLLTEVMKMLNRVVLVGRLTKDPDLRYTPNGVPVATFTLAVNRNFKNANGEQETDFVNCVVWKKPAENTANFLKKGSLAGVDGRIQTRHYEGQDGKRIYVTEVVAESVQFLEPKRDGQQQSNTNTSGNKQNHSQVGQTHVEDDPFANNGQINLSDDELPF